MMFEEALTCLKAGKSLHRASWDTKEGYLQIMKGMKHVWKIMLEPSPNAGNFIFAIDDFSADDWQEFELPKEPVEAELVAEAA
jgi:hypothetical protein